VSLVAQSSTRTYRYVHQLEPEGVANQVVCQDCGALQSSVGPSVLVRVGNVQFRNGHGVDLVRRLGHSALHRLLVLVRENRRHGGGFRGLELRMVKNGVRAVVGLGRLERLSGGSCLARRLGSACVGGAVTGDCRLSRGVTVWG
jgi:hypothetical protein